MWVLVLIIGLNNTTFYPVKSYYSSKAKCEAAEARDEIKMTDPRIQIAWWDCHPANETFYVPEGE